ncbi:roadblock/LC7 domain-containing protein [Streptomyces sp. SID3343]|uniref:roadblock/LC7 domain-containing protein n=1 Tax=Streptomyces sp. SID3343 TaxID=2690260 RepID=UPI001370DA30|nr:roadblock/LC7 domain-containing protein [Streptomyces sp. SID3343]MYV99286.1 roadblock/LC7 domain-containing protein [Streptomyces sp. SID3343]
MSHDAFDPDTFDFGKVDFLLDQAVHRVPHVHGVILLTADGLLRARTRNAPTEEVGQRMSAALSSLQSTSRSTAEFVGEAPAHAPDTGRNWRQLLVEFDHGYVLVVAAGEGAYLGVATGDLADLRQVGRWTQELVQSVGRLLVAPARVDVGSGA